MNNQQTRNYTLTLAKEIGKLWQLKDITPFGMRFESFYDKVLGHDVGKILACGCENYVLDILAGEDKRMDIDLRLAKERIDMPGYVEFELVTPCTLSAKYLVNNCPGRPQLIAWLGASTKDFFKDYPAFAYIRKQQA